MPSSTLTFFAGLVVEEIEPTSITFRANLISFVTNSARNSDSSFYDRSTSVAFFASNLEHNWRDHYIVWIIPLWHWDQSIESPLTFVCPLISSMVKALVWIRRNSSSPLISTLIKTLVWIRRNSISPLVSPLVEALVRIWWNSSSPLVTTLISPLISTLIGIISPLISSLVGVSSPLVTSLTESLSLVWIRRNSSSPLISSLVSTLTLIRVITPLITSLIKSLILIWRIKTLVACCVIPHPDNLLIQDTNCTQQPISKHKNLSVSFLQENIFYELIIYFEESDRCFSGILQHLYQKMSKRV